VVAVPLRAVGGTVGRDEGEVVKAKVGAAGSSGGMWQHIMDYLYVLVYILILYSNHLGSNVRWQGTWKRG